MSTLNCVHVLLYGAGQQGESSDSDSDDGGDHNRGIHVRSGVLDEKCSAMQVNELCLECKGGCTLKLVVSRN